MLIDSIQLAEGGAISNLVVASGSSFPSAPDLGELFFHIPDDTLYCYTGSWVPIQSGSNTGVNTSNDVASSSTVYPAWVSATSGSNQLTVSNTKLSFVPSTGVLSATQFSGSGAGLTNIPNSALSNGSITIGSTGVSLGGTASALAGLSSVTATVFVGSLSGNATSASNVTGGSAGQLVYQTATNTTSFATTANYGVVTTNSSGIPSVTTGASGVLQGSASSVPVWTIAPTLTGANFSSIPNSALTNSSVTIGTTSVSLGSSATTLAGLTSVTATTFTGSLSGNATSATTATTATSATSATTASTATALATGRVISLTGDVSGSTLAFDGTSAVSATTTLATVNSSPTSNSFSKVTVNGKGLVTATTSVASGDITGVLGFTPANKAGDTFTGAVVLAADPTQALGAATKQYVDNMAAGLTAKSAVATSTTAALPAVTYNNGTSGVGATLTATANGAIGSIGGVTPSAGSRILVKDQASALQNGIYVVTSAGSAGAPFVLTRAPEFDNTPTGEMAAGDFTYVSGGTLGGTQWVLTTPGTITVGTDAITWSQLTGAGVVTAGTGITVTGNQVANAGVLSITTSSGLSANTSATGNVSITNTGVTSLAGTANQVSVSGSTGAITLSLPQSINSGAAPTFAGTNFTSIPNGALTNSSVTINGTAVSLGGSATVTAAAGTLTGTTLNSTVVSSSLTSVGTVTSGTWSGSFGSVSGANLTNITGANVTGAVPTATNAGNIAIADDGATAIAVYPTWVTANTGNLPAKTTSSKLSFVPSTGVFSSTQFSGSGAGLTNIPNSALTNSSVTVNGTAISLGGSGTVTAAAGTLTGTTLNSTVTASSLTSVGTITSGTWSGSFGAVSGANLTNITGANVTGTVANATTAATANALNTANNYQVTRLGVGVAPSAWGSSYPSIDISSNAAIAGASTSLYLSSNSYYNGTNWVAKAAGTGGIYTMVGSAHTWYGMASVGAGATQTVTTTMTLDASGNLVATANVSAYSDERLKKDWAPLADNYVEQLANIKHGSYTRIDTDERQVGVSAQSLQTLLPEAVMDGDTLSVVYGNAAMVSAVELAKEVVSMKAEIAELKALIASLLAK